jgi:hypothetical protein
MLVVLSGVGVTDGVIDFVGVRDLVADATTRGAALT